MNFSTFVKVFINISFPKIKAMKTLLFTILLSINTILAFGQEKDFSLSKIKTFSGKYVFYNLEPYDSYSKAFFFENKVDFDNLTEEEIMKETIANASKVSGFQNEPFDAVIIKDGEEKSQAIKFKEISANNALAKVGKKEAGIYIFRACLPSNEYDDIGKIDVKWHKKAEQTEKAYIELIERAKKKYPNFNGMLFKDDDNKSAYLIKFRDLEINGGGFRAGDKASYSSGSQISYGEIIQLDNTKNEAKFKTLDEYGDEKVKSIDYKKLQSISNETYIAYIEKQNSEIGKHKFSVGEKVSWIDGKDPMYGEVVSLNAKSHDASVKSLNIYGEDKTNSMDFLKIEKLEESKFNDMRQKELSIIKKHQFEVGEKVSFIVDKKPKCGEVVSLNPKSHKATIKYLGQFAEDKSSDEQYLEVEKITDDKFSAEIAKYKEDAQKYKFSIGEKVTWSKGGTFSKSETINAEIVSLNEIDHKAVVKFLNKEGVEKQESVSYLDISKVK